MIDDPEEDEPLIGIAHLDGLIALVQASPSKFIPGDRKPRHSIGRTA